MDITKTRAQLCAMAAEELGLSDSANAASDQDIDTIDARVDGFLGGLAQREVVTIANEAEIPGELAEPLSELLANHVARIFGKPKMAATDRIMTEGLLRQMQSSKPTYETLKAEYY